MKRSSGILLPISSLPSPYGIGTMGKQAEEFIDFLAAAGQTWWQILPVGPTSYGDSPYQSFSTHAGNPYFIDLPTLVKEGLLKQEELDAIDWGDDPTRVAYDKIYNGRFPLLKKAMERGWDAEAEEIAAFRAENHEWIEDYALFMAVKRHFGMKAWTEWDEDIRLREYEALERYRVLVDEDVRLFVYIQFKFFQQWAKLREYAHSKHIGIIGDMPIYVAMDSADVWADPKSFQLDEKNVPVEVAGVTPDYFSADGQLWGNPLYNWELMEADGFGWWIRRVGSATRLYDVLRIDHFRGLESYWAVPYGETTAKKGHWVKGPGMKLVGVLTSWFGDMQFIAEDLGFLTPEVAKLTYALLDCFNGSDLLPQVNEAMIRLQSTFDAACAEHLPAARAFARAYDKEPIIYTVSAGLNSCVGYVMTNCLIMESLWKNSSPIHASEFFHGACEAFDADTAVFALMGIGKTRSLEERTVKFLRRKTEKLIVLDAAALDLADYPAFVRPLVASFVLNRLCAHYIDEMSYVMGHPVSSRRYMGVEKY